MYTRKFFIGYNQLLPGGQLWLGQWFVTTFHVTGVPVQPLFGSIDNLRFWETQLNSVEVRQSFYMILKAKIGGMRSAWLFDEGEGREIRSVTHGDSFFTLPEAQSRRPAWTFSYALNVSPNFDLGITTTFVNKTLETLALQICRRLIYDNKIVSSCGIYLRRSHVQFYYLTCLKDIQISGSVESAYISVTLYADYCHTKLGIKSSRLIQHLCHVIPFGSNWIGPKCDVLCVFGKADAMNETTCVCDQGYWGSGCVKECPGGALYPCSNHGKCDTLRGTCACDLNWQGAEDCSSCTPGWVGKDCSVAVSNKKFPSCSIFSGGHLSSFDGAHFSFSGVGEFWLINNAELKAQIRQISCSNGHARCINAIAFSYRNDWKIAMHAPYVKNGEAVFWLNDKVVKFVSKRINLASHTYLEYSSSTVFTISSESTSLHVKIRVIGTRISITGGVGGSLCKSLQAACGNCDGNQQNDFITTSGKTLEQMWRVQSGDSFFIYNYGEYDETQTPTGAEYALRFKGVGIETDLLPGVFTSTYVSVELLFKTDSRNSGTLYTYSQFTAMAVYIETTIKVRQGNHVWDTGVRPNLGKWNLLTLVYYRPTGKISLYFVDASGGVSQHTHTVKEGLYVAQGSIAIGQWVPGYTDWDVVSLQGFVGYIDEVRIWNRELTLSDVKISWTMNVQRQAPYLAILWKFNEGHGNVVYDIQSEVNLYIANVDNAPTWVYSSAPVVLLQLSIDVLPSQGIKAQAEQWCNSYVVNSALGSACSGLGRGSIGYYYRACIQTIISYDEVGAGVETVVAFADSCEISMNLTIWPARSMCNTAIFKNSRLVDWIGNNCNHPCVFGHRSLDSLLKCVCDKAVWGDNCDSFCPGGPFNQCNSRGACLSTTGTCDCDFRWRGKEDCSTCTPGYHGVDCSISVGPIIPGTSVCSISGSGHYVTLDRIKINVAVAGEFHAFTSQRLGISIQVRQLRQGSYSASRCVFVRAGSTSVAIHTSYGITSKVFVSSNGIQISQNTWVRLGATGFVFRRASHTSYEITGPENFRMIIYHRSTHFVVTMEMDPTACYDACGLLGQCGGFNPNSNCSESAITSLYNISQISQLDVDTFVKKWMVPTNDSGFINILKIAQERQILTSAGSCLFFNGTGLVSPPLVNIFVGNYVSIQFYVKAKDPVGQGGTIISFASNFTCAVTVLNGTIRVHVGLKSYDTFLTLETLKWNQISLVYRRDSGLLQFYRTSSQGIVRKRVLNIGLGVFAPGCSVGIAIWKVTDIAVNIPGFVGWLDELGIWNKRFDGVIIQQMWRVSVKLTLPGIAAYWNFNEGQGYVASSSIGFIDISFPLPPWISPAWMPSDVNISLTSTIAAVFPNKSLEAKAKELCRNIFLRGPFNEECGNATGNADYYYESCVMDVASSRSLESTKESTVQMASECQAALNLTTLPGQKLCNVYPSGRYDNWVGENCAIKCVYGRYLASECKCDHGYWGKNCSEECPGGAVNPCFGHGQCDVETGKCECETNWSGDELCSSCSPKWIGETCEIALRKNISSTKLCTIMENGNVMGFDNSIFSFSNVGEFQLISSSTIQVQVRQVPCRSGSVCLNAFALSINGEELSIHAPYANNGDFSIHLNGKRFHITDDTYINDLSIKQLTLSSLNIDVAGRLSIKTTFNDRYLSLEAQSIGSYCEDFEGLCGSCDPNANSSITSVLEAVGKGNKSGLSVDSFIKTNLSVNQGSIIVIDKTIHKETRIIYGGIYNLYFRFSAAVSNEIVGLFDSNTFTIQLLVKSCDPSVCGGVIISYASRITFYVSNHVTVKVGIGDEVYDTGIQTETNKWNMITLIFLRAELRLSIYITTSSGVTQGRNFMIGIYPFENGGTFAIGLWQPSSGASSSRVSHIFKGSLDEIRVWRRAIDYASISQSFSANVQADSSVLSGLWKFNGGEGYIAKDAISQNNLFFPKYPMRAPTWLFSDAPIDYVPAKNPYNKNETLKNLANEVCASFIFRGPINRACSSLDNITFNFYLRACIKSVISSGDQTQSLQVIITLSDYCQATLKLKFWPAQPLCNSFPGKAFPNWIGTNCTTPCIFGRPSNVTTDLCVCREGYFGNNCSGICPGGPSNTCNRHGSCTTDSGICLCEINWRGSENCTACSPGWIGNDCSMAITEVIFLGHVRGIASLGIRGHFGTFTGVNLIIRTTGEYYLVYSSHLSIQLQVRLVSCFELESCINSIALRISSHTFVIHGPYTSDQAIITWLNGKVIDIDVNPPSVSVYGFVFVRISIGLYEFRHRDITIKIRVEGRYLNLDVKASTLLCNTSVGLLGNCNQDLLTLFESFQKPKNCSEVIDQHINVSEPLVQSNRSNLTTTKFRELSTKFKVLPCQSLFVYSYKEVTEFRDANAGYALHFNHTAVITSTVIIKAFISNDITFDLMINIQQNGLIFSYSKSKTLYVTTVGGKFSLHFGNTIYATNITAELDSWTQLSLVYKKSAGKLQLYYFFSNGVVQRMDIKIAIGMDIFEPGGYLALAGWIPPINGTGSQPKDIFVGFIDQVRIWTRRFHPALIQQIREREVLVKTDDLAHAWRFNEGEGTLPIDTMGDVNFELTTSPWMVPSWRFSEAKLNAPFVEASPSYTFANDTFKNDSEIFCHRLVLKGPLYRACSGLGQGAFAFYFRSCLRRIASSGELHASLKVIIKLSDYCQSVFNLDVWPAKPLCNEFPGAIFPTWYGPECNQKCDHGLRLLPNVCKCHRGYFGSDCSKVCPGGADNPCNNHGDCNPINGQCVCRENWKGTADCGSCSTGWFGSDCSVAITSIPDLRISYSVASYGGRYVTFDGVNFAFLSLGEFYVILSPVMHFSIQIRQVPCWLQSVCINAISIQVFDTVVSFHGPYSTGTPPVIWINNIAFPITGLLTNIGPVHLGLRFWIDSQHRYVIALKEDVVIHIRVEGKYLSFNAEVQKPFCANSTGLLGSCDGLSENDLAGLPINTTQEHINNHLANKLVPSPNNTLFVLEYGVYKETKKPSGGLYALMFNNTGASGTIFRTFVSNSDLTLELLFKAMYYKGTILCYANVKTFALIIDTSIKIHFGHQVMDTGIVIYLHYWSHMSLVWHYRTQILEIYHFDYKGLVKRINFNLQENPFIPGGILSLGQWELSPGETEELTSTPFIGVIDEIRVWHRSFDPVLIQQNFKMNVHPTHPSLGSLWKLNEGEGDIIHDLVSNEHLYLPRKPWQQPTWIYSDADVKTNLSLTATPHYNNETFKKVGKAFCLELFYESELRTLCGSLQSELEFHYLLCIQDVGTVGKLSASLTSVITFADHCESVLSLSYWPARSLCNSIPGSEFPNWIGDRCDVKCVFGKPKSTNRNMCECYHGYWGSDCARTCPGGTMRTCANHGRCVKKTGRCNCQINWQGSENCTSCSSGWYGKECQFAVGIQRRSPSSIQIASAGNSGYITSFIGLSFIHRVHGEFYLLRSYINNFNIQIRRGFCSSQNTHSTSCTVAFSFSYKDVVIAIRAPITAIPRTSIVMPFVWINGHLVRIDHVTNLSSYFVMVRVSSQTFLIMGPDWIRFSVRVSHSLGLTLSIPPSYCQNSTGLLGSCKYLTLNDTETVERAYASIISGSAVNPNDTLFSYDFEHYHEYQEITGGGFCLNFRDSFVVSKPLDIQIVDILTLELLVRVKEYGGVVLSFAQEATFAVINDVTLKIAYKKQQFDTKISLEIDQWNQITLAFYQLIGKLEVYIFDRLGNLRVRVFMLDKDVWKKGGVLAFGQWLPSENSMQPPHSTFNGDIDEVRMWKRRNNPDIVKRNPRLNVQPRAYPDLLHLWKLNDVEGGIVRDTAGSDDLYLKAFHEPEREFSNSNIPTYETNEPLSKNGSLDELAESFCRSVILEGPLFENCLTLGRPVAQSYYNTCFDDVSLSGDTQTAFDTVISFADYCQEALELSEWPARKLCNRFPEKRFRDWIGHLCNTKCVFGYAAEVSHDNGVGVRCKCEEGYWGEDCSKLCKGGLWNICNGHGMCDAVSGQCRCSEKWNGTDVSSPSRPCSVCTEGWAGTDCAIAADTSNINDKTPSMSMNFGDPHFTTTNGVNYNFEVPGAYLMINSSIFTAQILQVPCNNRLSCRRISEITLNTSSFVLSARYTDPNEVETTLLNYNSKTTTGLTRSKKYEKLPKLKGAKPKYRWLTADILEVFFNKNERLHILIYNGTLGVGVEMPSKKKSKIQTETHGLCGARTGNLITSLRDGQSKGNSSLLNQPYIDKKLSSMLQVPPKNNFLTTSFAKYPFTAAGFMVQFSSTYIYLALNENLPVLEEFTFELWVCLVNDFATITEKCSPSQRIPSLVSAAPITNKQALFSFSTDSVNFAVLHNDNITIMWNDQDARTNLTIKEGIWTHVSISWRTNDGRVTIMTANEELNSTTSLYGIHLGSKFVPDGSLFLGRYVKAGEIVDGYSLIGALDELRLWQYAKSEQEIISLRKSKFDHYYLGLLMNLPFDEGYGRITNAWVYEALDVSLKKTTPMSQNDTGRMVALSVQPENASPVWLPSSVSLTPLTNYTVYFRNNTQREEAIKICHKWFYTGDVQKLCSAVLVSQARFYYEACISDIADSGSLAHHKLSISLFGFYCQKILDIKECKLHGTFDAFPPCKKSKKEEDVPKVVIITTSVITVLLLFILCLLCLFFVRKRRKTRIKRAVIEPEVLRKFTLSQQDNSEMEMKPITQTSYKKRDGESSDAQYKDTFGHVKTKKGSSSSQHDMTTNQHLGTSKSLLIDDSDSDSDDKHGVENSAYGIQEQGWGKERRDKVRKNSSSAKYHMDEKDPSSKVLMYGCESDSDVEDQDHGSKGKGPAKSNLGPTKALLMYGSDTDSSADDAGHGRSNKTYRESTDSLPRKELGGNPYLLPKEDYDTDSDNELKTFYKGRSTPSARRKNSDEAETNV